MPKDKGAPSRHDLFIDENHRNPNSSRSAHASPQSHPRVACPFVREHNPIGDLFIDAGLVRLGAFLGRNRRISSLVGQIGLCHWRGIYHRAALYHWARCVSPKLDATSQLEQVDWAHCIFTLSHALQSLGYWTQCGSSWIHQFKGIRFRVGAIDQR